jgi:hypothetical protein
MVAFLVSRLLPGNREGGPSGQPHSRTGILPVILLAVHRCQTLRHRDPHFSMMSPSNPT